MLTSLCPGGSSRTSPRTQDAGHLWPVSQCALSCPKNLIFTNCPAHPQALIPAPGSPSSIRAQKRDPPTAKITPSEGCRLGQANLVEERESESRQGHRVRLHGPCEHHSPGLVYALRFSGRQQSSSLSSKEKAACPPDPSRQLSNPVSCAGVSAGVPGRGGHALPPPSPSQGTPWTPPLTLCPLLLQSSLLAAGWLHFFPRPDQCAN